MNGVIFHPDTEPDDGLEEFDPEESV